MAIIKDPEVEPSNYEIEGEPRQQRVIADLHQGCSGAARDGESCKAATAATATFFALLYDGSGGGRAPASIRIASVAAFWSRERERRRRAREVVEAERQGPFWRETRPAKIEGATGSGRRNCKKKHFKAHGTPLSMNERR